MKKESSSAVELSPVSLRTATTLYLSIIIIIIIIKSIVIIDFIVNLIIISTIKVIYLFFHIF